jgi:hypothetical protein
MWGNGHVGIKIKKGIKNFLILVENDEDPHPSHSYYNKFLIFRDIVKRDSVGGKHRWEEEWKVFNMRKEILFIECERLKPLVIFFDVYRGRHPLP